MRRRNGKSRRLARHFQALLYGWLAGGISLRGGGEFFLVEDGDARGVHGQPSAAGPRGSAGRFLRGNDGVGAADKDAATILRPGKRIRLAARRADVSAGRLLARLLPQVSGVQSAAQENAAGVSGGGLDSDS